MTDQDTVTPVSQNLRVDNEGFFDAVERHLESVLSPAEIHAQTRKEIQSLMAEMRQRDLIRWVTEWTATEQQNFAREIQGVVDTGILFSGRLREVLKEVVEGEVWREINDDGYKVLDGNGNTITTSGDYQYFLSTSFLAEVGRIIPLDLSLTVHESDSIESARAKIRRYHGRYNALILLDDMKRPTGIVRTTDLDMHEHAGNSTLAGIERSEAVMGHYDISREEATGLMRAQGINILPIVDTDTGALIGILTTKNVEEKNIQYYSTVSLAKLSLDCLRL